MTATEARQRWNGTVKAMVLCKGELFYLVPTRKNGIYVWHTDTVYPMDRKAAAKEAEFFGVELSEQ